MGLHSVYEDKKTEVEEFEAYKRQKEAQAAETAGWRSLFASEKDNKLLNAYNKNYPQNSIADAINQYGSQQFSYNPATDPNYQAYLKLAKENAGLAMQDTLAKASAMTGGYSNSNAQLAGQKVYNQHLSEAEGRVGDYYAMALDAFNAEQNNLLNQIELAWAAEDRNKQNAQFKAEYGDYSGLVGLGVSPNAVDKYKANADWATQYAKDSAAYENAWKLAEATGDYTTLYKQLGYTDQQIANLQTNKNNAAYLDEIASKASQIKDNDELMLYLESAAHLGYIDPVTAADLYELYSSVEEPAEETQGQLPLRERTWIVVSYGGAGGKDGINNNAKIKDEYGNEWKIGDLYKQLKKFYPEEEAKTYIENLQKELEIRG